MASGLENIETIESPFRRFVTTIGVFPTAFTDAMTYYECLAYLVKYLEETVIPAVNENAEAVEELQRLYIQLKSYVDNYFANLDVQEEINNKLDEMVDDGTLPEIITSYIQTNVAWTFDTVADMKTSTNLIAGSYARTLGFHSINDGGGATYYITDSGTADEMQVIAIGTLFANLVIDNEINVKQLGAYGDGETDDTTVITKALTLNYPVYIPKGTYIVSSTLTLNNRIVHGDGQFNTFIRFTNDISSYAVTINSDHNKISDLTIESPDYDYEVKGTTNAKTGIYISQHHHLTLNNVRIVGFNVGMYANRAWCLSLYDVMTLCCNTGLSGDVDFNNILLERCTIHTCTTGLLINSGSGIKIDACDIENNDTGVQVVNNVSVNLDTCYFERNSVCSVYIRFGTTWVRQVVIENCTFYENSTVSAIKYHSDPSANITIQNCDFRNNPTLSAGTLRILLRESNSNNVPHVIGCFIGNSWTLGERCYLNKLYPEALTATDMFDVTSGYEFQDFAVYVENNHVFGTATVYNASGIPASNTVVATFKDKFKPITVPLTFGALSSAQYGQDSNNLCYVYMNSYSGLTIKGDGTHTRARISFDYVI